MVLAHDAACHMDWLPDGLQESALPNWNFTYIPSEVIPALRERGVTAAQITTMLVETPRAFLTGSSPVRARPSELLRTM